MLDLVLVPTETDAEHEPSAAFRVERRDRLGRDDRLTLRREQDAGAEHDALGAHRRRSERDEGIDRPAVFLGKLGVARWRRRAPRHRDVRVLGQVQRVDATRLGLDRELPHGHRAIGCEHRDAVAHAVTVPNPHRTCLAEEGLLGICEGRVVIVTGAGRGLGREHALEFGRQGASVVVNDLGVDRTGHGRESTVAGEVVEELRGLGAAAIANGDDIADFDGAGRLVQTAIDTFGGLDTLVCNAGFVRDRMFANTAEDEWDAIIRVHLKGHFAPARHAAAYWRDEAKANAAVRAAS